MDWSGTKVGSRTAAQPREAKTGCSEKAKPSRSAGSRAAGGWMPPVLGRCASGIETPRHIKRGYAKDWSPFKYFTGGKMKRFLFVLVAAALSVAWLGTRRSGASSDKAVPTFTKDVAPIIYAKCMTCHRDGEAVPMKLTSYHEVRPWSRDIAEQVVKKTMPPWYADDQSSVKFANQRQLTQDEINTITAWVEAGSPKGDDGDLPQMPKFATGWSLGEPDLVIPMPVEFDVPAEGEVPMQNFYVPVPFKEERWVQAVELRPGNPAVVHHSIVNVTSLPEGSRIVNGRAVRVDAGVSATAGAAPAATSAPGSALREGGDEVVQTQDSFTRSGAYKLVGQAPGKGCEVHRLGTAKRIKPGMYFQFNLHYQPDGRPEKDRSMLGLYFAKGPVTREVMTKGIIDHIFIGGQELGSTKVVDGKTIRTRAPIPNIPAYADNWEIMGQSMVTQDITIDAFAPHMHLRGKDIKYIVQYPDGHQQTVLLVPKYDFNWQIHYELESPLKVPSGSKLIAIAHYDNSLKNRYNPAPQKEVYWAEQSWDEMFIPWFEYTVDSQDLTRDMASASSIGK
jgi:hypothetical protein